MSAKSPISDALRDPPRMSFTARVVSADARELIKQLHGQVLAQYATMPKRGYNRQAARGKLPRLIGAMVGELLHVRTTNQTLGWMSLNLRDDYLRTFGYGWQSFPSLLYALQNEGLIECLRGYYPAWTLNAAPWKKCAHSRINQADRFVRHALNHPDSLSDHFKILGTKKSRTRPRPKNTSNDIVAHLNKVLNLENPMTFQMMVLEIACSRHEIAFVAKQAGVRPETLWRYRTGAARTLFETLIKILAMIGAKLLIVAD
jgi:DNA-binding phage protein